MKRTIFGCLLLLLPMIAAAGDLPASKDTQDREDMIVLSRELAKSSDSLLKSKKKKGLCGQSQEDLGKLMQALRIEMDSLKISEKEISSVLKKKKICGSGCKKALCQSPSFKKIEAEKEKMGSAKDGV